MSPYAWSVLSFFLGAYLGHRLSLGRDRRKEFNEAALPVRNFVLTQISVKSSYPVDLPSNLEIDSFVQRLMPWQRIAFRDAWRTIETGFTSSGYDPELGGFIYSCSDDVMPALLKIQSFAAIK